MILSQCQIADSQLNTSQERPSCCACTCSVISTSISIDTTWVHVHYSFFHTFACIACVFIFARLLNNFAKTRIHTWTWQSAKAKLAKLTKLALRKTRTTDAPIYYVTCLTMCAIFAIIYFDLLYMLSISCNIMQSCSESMYCDLYNLARLFEALRVSRKLRRKIEHHASLTLLACPQPSMALWALPSRLSTHSTFTSFHIISTSFN